MTNEQLKQIIQKIEVDKVGNVDIYLRLFGDLGLDEAVLIDGSYDTEGLKKDNLKKTNEEKSKENKALISNNHT